MLLAYFCIVVSGCFDDGHPLSVEVVSTERLLFVGLYRHVLLGGLLRVSLSLLDAGRDARG